MKKYLSILLAAIMVFSTVAFAAPSAVDTVETADEAVVDASAVFEAQETTDDAELESDSELGQLVFNLDFEDNEIGTQILTSTNTPKICDFVPEGKRDLTDFSNNLYIRSHNAADIITVQGNETNKYAKFDSTYKWPRLGVIAGNNNEYFPAGSYTVT